MCVCCSFYVGWLSAHINAMRTTKWRPHRPCALCTHQRVGNSLKQVGGIASCLVKFQCSAWVREPNFISSQSRCLYIYFFSLRLRAEFDSNRPAIMFNMAFKNDRFLMIGTETNKNTNLVDSGQLLRIV